MLFRLRSMTYALTYERFLFESAQSFIPRLHPERKSWGKSFAHTGMAGNDYTVNHIAWKGGRQE